MKGMRTRVYGLISCTSTCVLMALSKSGSATVWIRSVEDKHATFQQLIRMWELIRSVERKGNNTQDFNRWIK